jgi:ubiquinone/menaquinone biosynthesis C-methylase UbiE
MNCDRIAPVYRWFEYLSFGRRLEAHRFRFLDAFRQSQRALLLGDGDGRFLAALAQANSKVAIDSVDVSTGMLCQAEQRLAQHTIPNPGRIHLLQGDARYLALPSETYDLIATHFFLDCFSREELHSVVTKLRKAAAPGAQWVVSEFRQPPTGLRNVHAKLWLKTMYLFFRLATGLRTNRLTDHRPLLCRAGFVLMRESGSMLGLIASELWTLNDTTDASSHSTGCPEPTQH